MISLEILSDREAPRSLPLGEGAGLRFLAATGNGGDGLKLTEDNSTVYLAAFLAVRGQWVVVARPAAEAMTVNGLPVVGFKVLDPGDLLEAAGWRLRFSPQVIEKLAPDHPLIRKDKVCPVCQQEFESGQTVVYCPVCGVAHHTASQTHPDDCLSYNGRCGSNPFCGYILPKNLADGGEGD